MIKKVMPFHQSEYIPCKFLLLLLMNDFSETGNIRIFEDKLPISSAQTCLKVK